MKRPIDYNEAAARSYGRRAFVAHGRTLATAPRPTLFSRLVAWLTE